MPVWLSSQRFVVIFALFLFTLCALYALFGQRPLDFDEAGIFNAPYMVAEHSKVSYPIWVSRFPESFNSYWFHPPSYYVLLGTALKFLSVYYAEGVLPTVFFALALFFAVTLRAEPHEKYAYAFASFALLVLCVETQMGNFGTRPDMSASLAWFAGVLALEKARRNEWSRGAGLAGALLVSIATTFHYITLFFSLTIVVYCVIAWLQTDRKSFARAAAMMALGSVIVAIPYFWYFLIPDFDNIMKWLTEAETSNLHGHNPLAIFLFKLETHARSSLQWSQVELFRYFPGALQKNFVPLGLVANLGLLIFKSSRAIGWAVLPQIIFIYFIADKTQPFYLIPEYLLLFVFISLLASKLVEWIFLKFSFQMFVSPVCFVLAVSGTIYLIVVSPKYDHAFKNAGSVQHHWMDVARAAAQTIIGPNAVVGDYAAIWYITGARYWYPEGYGRPLYPPKDELKYVSGKQFFAHYELRTLEGQFAGHAGTASTGVLGAWVANYAKGRLNLNGVVNVPGTAIVFYSSQKRAKFQHYQINSDSLMVERFRGGGTGNKVAGVYLCTEIKNKPKRHLFEHVHGYATFLKIDGRNPQAIGIFRTTAENFTKLTAELNPGCFLKDVVRGSVSRLSFAEFINEVPAFHKDMSFFRNREEALRASNQGR